MLVYVFACCSDWESVAVVNICYALQFKKKVISNYRSKEEEYNFAFAILILIYKRKDAHKEEN